MLQINLNMLQVKNMLQINLKWSCSSTNMHVMQNIYNLVDISNLSVLTLVLDIIYMFVDSHILDL